MLSSSQISLPDGLWRTAEGSRSFDGQARKSPEEAGGERAESQICSDEQGVHRHKILILDADGRKAVQNQ